MYCQSRLTVICLLEDAHTRELGIASDMLTRSGNMACGTAVKSIHIYRKTVRIKEVKTHLPIQVPRDGKRSKAEVFLYKQAMDLTRLSAQHHNGLVAHNGSNLAGDV
jgi:hypothetical protein